MNGKGEGGKVRAWLKEYHGETLYLKVARMEMGTRQDIATEAAFAAYWNRPKFVDFLKASRVSQSQLLRDHCYVEMTSPVIIAALRARAIFHDKFTTHTRFLSASTTLEGWSALDMAPVMALLEAELKLIIENPARMMDAEFNIFEPLVATTPAYSDFLKELKEATAKSVDKKEEYNVYEKVRAELYSPVEKSNHDSTGLTKELLAVMASGMLKTLRNGQGARYCPGGEYSAENQTDEMKAVFEGTWRNTNASEGAFGHIKYILEQFTNLKLRNASAMACAKKDGLFSSISSQFEAGDQTKKRKVEVGLLDERSTAVQRALIRYAQGPGKKASLDEWNSDAAKADAAMIERAKVKMQVRTVVIARRAAVAAQQGCASGRRANSTLALSN
jgi:hypothetical protein